MANIYWSGEKSSEEDAISSLKKVVPDIWNNAFYVRFKDRVLELVVEMKDVDSPTGLWEHFPTGKYMGHQMHILKVPIGYTNVIKSRNS